MTWQPVRFIDVREARLAYDEVGDPTAPVLVLVSGGASAKEWWDDELCELLAAGGRRVVRFDLRDVGQSTAVPPGEATYTQSDLVEDLAAVVEHTGSAPAHVWGVSLGAGLAQALATRRPELVATLTLQSATLAGPGSGGGDTADLPGPTPELLATFEQEVGEPDWDEPASVAAWYLADLRPYAGTLGVDEEQVVRTALRIVAHGGPQRSAGNHFLVDSGPDAVEPSQIIQPTLVIHGDADPLFPLEHGHALAAAVPRAELLIVPGMGHEHPPRASWMVIVPAVLAHTR